MKQTTAAAGRLLVVKTIPVAQQSSQFDENLDIAAALRERRTVSDTNFDAIYPRQIRAVSSVYWTPVEVAKQAARLLQHDTSTRVLDVGSGVGKFCLVGALTTEGHFTGIEHREHLVNAARQAANRLAVEQVSFFHGVLQLANWRSFNAFYFFNPFAENYFEGTKRLDDSVVLTPERFEWDLRFVIAKLRYMPVGTRVVTYHGLGRDLPAGYRRQTRLLAGSDVLELWIQTRT